MGGSPDGSGLRRIAAGAVGALTSLLLATGTAGAAPPGSSAPLHVSFPVAVTYEIPELTEGCGVEVWFALEGTFKGTIFQRHGEVVGEFDSQPNTWMTLYSPETGRSIRNPFATTFHNKYPEGVDPGDPVIATATGFGEKLPGVRARAGRMYFPAGQVIEVVDGIPYVDYGEPASFTGSQFDPEAGDAAICRELAGT